MEGYDQYDISGASFEEFVIFVFDHDVVTRQEKEEGTAKPWYWRAEVTLDTQSVLGFYRRLFEAPEFLLTRYNKEQLEQGFWAMMGQPDFGRHGDHLGKESSFRGKSCVRAVHVPLV